MTNPLRWLLRKLTLYVFEYIHSLPETQRIEILGRPFDIFPQVYNPHYSRLLNFPSSEHLAKHLSVRPGDKILDLGTGIGVQAVFAALGGGQVIATDINPEAGCCAEHNVMLNQVDRCVDVRIGDLFAPVHNEQFDLIIWLPPSFFADPVHLYQWGWMCGSSGDVLDRFCNEVQQYLKAGGRVQFSCVDRNRQFILSRLKEKGFQWRLMAPPLKRFPLETVTLYEAW